MNGIERIVWIFRGFTAVDFKGAPKEGLGDCEVVAVWTKAHQCTFGRYVLRLHLQRNQLVFLFSFFKMHKYFTLLFVPIHQHLLHPLPPTPENLTNGKIVHFSHHSFRVTLQNHDGQILLGCVGGELLSNFMTIGKVLGNCLYWPRGGTSC